MLLFILELPHPHPPTSSDSKRRRAAAKWQQVTARTAARALLLVGGAWFCPVSIPSPDAHVSEEVDFRLRR